VENTIAFTDTETTGLEAGFHEIVEIGLVVADRETLRIVDTFDTKIKPKHIERASPKALQVNGYNEEEWQNAPDLKWAMKEFGLKTIGSIMCAQNITFDYNFIRESFKQTGIKDLMSYHRIDLFTLSWVVLKDKGITRFSLKEVCKFIGVEEEPDPHVAINGAMAAYQVYCKLMNKIPPE